MFMPEPQVLDALPLWVLFLCTVGVVLLAAECGYLLGRSRHPRVSEEKESPVGAMVGATLGLLAFLLAFTFGMAATRYDTRMQLVREEANAIRTTWLRADFLTEPQRSEVRQLLREYVNIRVEAVEKGSLPDVKNRSEEIQHQMWARVATLAPTNRDSNLFSLFVQSLNEMIDYHWRRLQVGFESRVPASIWVVLYGVAILAMTSVGYHAGSAGTSRTLAILMLGVTFSVALMMVVDLDRPGIKVLRVNQQATLDLQQMLNQAKP
jgi:hypothetical protein